MCMYIDIDIDIPKQTCSYKGGSIMFRRWYRGCFWREICTCMYIYMNIRMGRIEEDDLCLD